MIWRKKFITELEGEFEMKKQNSLEDMTLEELGKEKEFINECLRDEEELYDFTFNKSSVHIGGIKSREMQEKYEEKCREYNERIKKIEELLRR